MHPESNDSTPPAKAFILRISLSLPFLARREPVYIDWIYARYFQKHKKTMAKSTSNKDAESRQSEVSKAKDHADGQSHEPSSTCEDPKKTMVSKAANKVLDIKPSRILDVNEPKGSEGTTKPPEPSRDPEPGPNAPKTPYTQHSWVPRCPHCDRANEYGYPMCDPVHPRMCAGGDF